MRKIIFISLAVLMAGCASRQKEVHKSISEVDFSSSIDTTAKVTKHVDNEKTKAEIVRQQFLNTQVEYEGNKGDSLSIDQYGADGNLLSRTVFHGKGKYKSSSGQTNTEKQLKEKEKVKEDAKLQAAVKKKIQLDADIKNIDKEIEASGILCATWFWLLIVCCAIMIIAFIRWKLKQGKALKNHITDDYI